MGSAMLHGWLSDANLDAEFAIIEPMMDHLAWTNEHDNVRLYASIADAATKERAARMIVLAVKPQMMDEAIAGLGALVGTDTAFLSIAAGIPTGWFHERLGADAMVLRSMPNTPAAIGKGVTALFAAEAPADLVSLATTLLSAVGTVVMLDDESLMDLITSEIKKVCQKTGMSWQLRRSWTFVRSQLSNQLFLTINGKLFRQTDYLNINRRKSR